MLHEPAESSGADGVTDFKMHVGVWMFLLYALVYAGFVAINVISPLRMETIVFFGLNLAVVYGMGLIVLAFVLALIYSRICARRERDFDCAPTVR